MFAVVGRVARTFSWKQPLLARGANPGFTDPDAVAASLALMEGLLDVVYRAYDRLEPVVASPGQRLQPEEEERASVYAGSRLLTYLCQTLELWSILTREPDVFETLLTTKG